MSAVELLRSTQRAIASEEMTEWHDELIKMRRDQRNVENQGTSDRETLVNLENRQRMQEADVQRLREREEAKERIRLLDAVKPVAMYKAKLGEFDTAKRQKNEAGRELEGLEASVEPTLRAVNAKQAYRDAVRAARDDRSKAVTNAERLAKAKAEKIEALQNKIKTVDREQENEKKDAKNDRTELKRLSSIISSLQRQLDQGPADFDITACLEQLVSSLTRII